MTGRSWRRCGPGSATGRRRGVALPLALLLLIVLTLLSAGGLRLADAAAGTSRTASDVGLARVRARSVMRGTLSTLLADTLPTTPPGAATPLEAPTGWDVRLETLSGELSLVSVLSSGSRSRDRAAREQRLVWALDPLVRSGRIPAVAEVGGVVSAPAGTLVSGDFYGVSDPEARWCGAVEAELAAVGAERASPVRASASLSPPPVGGIPGLGPLVGDSIRRTAEPITGDRVTPVPAQPPDACGVGDAPNWGSPTDPDGPCGAHFALAGAAANLAVVNGEGQGVLVVAGDLVLEGTTFSGLALVGGSLILRDGARFDGAVRVAGDLFVDPSALLVGRACRVVAALRALPSLRYPVAVPGRLIPLR